MIRKKRKKNNEAKVGSIFYPTNKVLYVEGLIDKNKAKSTKPLSTYRSCYTFIYIFHNQGSYLVFLHKK